MSPKSATVVSNDCPVDEKATTECRGAGGVCDVAEVCDGVSNDCPADEKATTECRSAAGVCDVAEVCDGVSNDCPADGKATTECRAVAGVCDVAEVCDGVNNDCPIDLKLGGETLCRPAVGVCDWDEVCNGMTDACPADGFLVFGATCEGTNQCDGEGNCLDCVDAFGCEDLSFGERAEACTESGFAERTTFAPLTTHLRGQAAARTTNARMASVPTARTQAAAWIFPLANVRRLARSGFAERTTFAPLTTRPRGPAAVRTTNARTASARTAWMMAVARIMPMTETPARIKRATTTHAGTSTTTPTPAIWVTPARMTIAWMEHVWSKPSPPAA